MAEWKPQLISIYVKVEKDGIFKNVESLLHFYVLIWVEENRIGCRLGLF